MALQKQLMPLSYGGGLDTKTDQASVPLGKWLILENAIFTKPGSLHKRNGYSSLTASILAGGSLAAGSALASRANELLLADGSNLYSYDQANTAWANKGTLQEPTLSSIGSVAGNVTLVGYDTALHSGGLQCIVCDVGMDGPTGNQVNGPGYCVIDTATGQVVAPLTIMESSSPFNAFGPKVCVLGNFFLMFWLRSNVLYAQAVAISAPQTLVYGSPQAVTSGVGTSALAIGNTNYDVTVSNGNAYVVFRNRSGTTTIFGITAASPYAQPNTAIVAATAPQAICICGNSFNNDVVVGITQGDNKATAFAYNSNLSSQTLAPTDIDTGQTLVDSIAAISTSAAATAIQFYIGCGQGAPVSCYIRKQTLGAAYALGTASTMCRSVVLAGKPLLYNGTTYLPAWFTSQGLATNLQSTWFLLNSSGRVVAKAFPSAAAGCDAYGPFWRANLKYPLLGSSPNVSSGKFNLVVGNAIRITGIVAGSGTIRLQIALQLLRLDFTDTTNPYTRAELANALLIGGAIPTTYDGAQAVEHGFLASPENVTGVAGGAGSLSAGSYQYVVLYEWQDASGIVHRSAPSPALTKVAVLNDNIVLTIPTLRLTARTSAVAGVVIQVYRTVANGTIFFRLTNNNTGSSPNIQNNPAVDTVTLNDMQSDGTITNKPQLYTASGELQADQPPPLHSVIAHRNRIFGIDPTTGQLSYSKVVSVGTPVEFSTALVMAVDARGGFPTAIASLDEKLIIFKKDRIFVVLGDGPDSNGSNNNFTDAGLVSSDTGCTVPKSIVTVPDGLMFKSPKGFYLLDRSLRVSYIGAPVEAYNSANVTSAQLIPGVNQVRFTLDSGVALVYDYRADQWGTFTNINATDATIWQGNYVYLTSAGVANQETAGVFSDPGSTFIAIKAVSPWVQLAQVQGFQRIYKLLVLASYVSAHKLRVKLAYDFATSFAQTDDITVSSDPAPYQYRVHCAKQRCEAFQVSVEDVSTGTIGEALSLSGLTIEVGVKRGTFRLPASKSFG